MSDARQRQTDLESGGVVILRSIGGDVDEHCIGNRYHAHMDDIHNKHKQKCASCIFLLLVYINI